MKTARGAIAIRISDDAEKLQRETIDNYKGIAQAQAGYHSAHHSFNYYWHGYSQEQIDRLSAQMGRKWNGGHLEPQPGGDEDAALQCGYVEDVAGYR